MRTQGQFQQEALLPGHEGQTLWASQEQPGSASATGIQRGDRSPEQGVGCWKEWGNRTELGLLERVGARTQLGLLERVGARTQLGLLERVGAGTQEGKVDHMWWPVRGKGRRGLQVKEG